MSKKRPEAPTDAPPIEAFPDLLEAGLPDLCRQYRELLDQEAALGKAKRELMSMIAPLAESSGARSIAGDTYVLAYSAGSTTSKISAEKLLAKGVKMATIEACTEHTQRDGYWQVRAKANGRA